jgi:hypothetical protein
LPDANVALVGVTPAADETLTLKLLALASKRTMSPSM